MTLPRIEAAGAPRPQRPVGTAVLDLDGTCLDSDQRLHPRTRSAVRRAVAGGCSVILASGRMYRSALPWARRLGVRAPLICYGGAVVQELPREGDAEHDGIPRGPVLAVDALEPSTALRALALARAGGWHVQAYQDDRVLCDRDRPEAHLYARVAGVPITRVADLEPLLEHGTTKLLCVVEDPGEVRRCEARLRAELAGAANVTRSLPPYVEVTSPTASKGRALRRLAPTLGLDLGRAVAVGDAANDRDMLAAVGFGVAVEGGGGRLEDVARAACAPPEQAGVADVLEALGLS